MRGGGRGDEGRREKEGGSQRDMVSNEVREISWCDIYLPSVVTILV